MIFNTARLIYNHPFNSDNKIAGLIRFLKWQISSKLTPYPIIYSFTEHSKLIIKKGLTSATGNLYCGLFEYYDMAFLLHFLRPNDLFIDIGANIGIYTVLASAEIGASSISIEPIPSTYKHLLDNIFINKIEDKVQALNIGLGSEKKLIKFTNALGAVNHVATEEETNTIDISVETLDSVTTRVPALLKIDVEGFETEVLNGASNILANSDLKAIIIELNGSGKRYGYDENKIHEKLLGLNFRPFTYNPQGKVLTEASSYINSDGNGLYIRDVEYVMDRIENSGRIKVGNKNI
jgi:FkbM family methyltransferase